jgi:hypothetical protein
VVRPHRGMDGEVCMQFDGRVDSGKCKGMVVEGCGKCSEMEEIAWGRMIGKGSV